MGLRDSCQGRMRRYQKIFRDFKMEHPEYQDRAIGFAVDIPGFIKIYIKDGPALLYDGIRHVLDAYPEK